jgi:hypothetical protein
VYVRALQAPVDFFDKKTESTPLAVAALQGSVKVLRILLDSGANVRMRAVVAAAISASAGATTAAANLLFLVLLLLLLLLLPPLLLLLLPPPLLLLLLLLGLGM